MMDKVLYSRRRMVKVLRKLKLLRWQNKNRIVMKEMHYYVYFVTSVAEILASD